MGALIDRVVGQSRRSVLTFVAKAQGRKTPKVHGRETAARMAKLRIIGSVLVILLVGGALAAFAVVWRPEIAEIDPPTPQSFSPDLVKRGRELAAIGNCSDCHTARGGKNFAGGVPVPTPFGTIFSSNITPDPETGIGRWSEEAFRRAMRTGVDREGEHLYPTFPFDHFTHVTDGDDRALYAFLMTREPVRARARKRAFVPVQSALHDRGMEIVVSAS
jgi:mono/diheme cytochrome c family protein